MADFPRTEMGGVSVSRLVMGTNWWLGFSHTSQAKDCLIRETMTAEKIADVMEVFLRAGVDTSLGTRPEEKVQKAVKIAEDRVGRHIIQVGTPGFNLDGSAKAASDNQAAVEAYARIGCEFCWPHQSTTDALCNRVTRSFPGLPAILKLIRDHKMIPGLSTHMPEAPVYADETNLDVAGYVQIYNAVGFLMQIEVDWVHRMIWQCKKPVITIKPLAVNKVMPLVGMAFNWATIRPCDMVCIGTSTPDEAKEILEISHSILERRQDSVQLQRTRSKASVERKKKSGPSDRPTVNA